MESAVVLTSIGGTLHERITAFNQIASTVSSGIFPAGYNTAPKILAACWFADGLGVHPTVFMEGVQPVEFGGKTVREPKWEFVNALLRARLQGFDFEVHEDSDKVCEITFVATERRSQRVKYTMEEAVQQGLAGPNGRNRDTYAKNPRKMLWKQCFKMGADRLGADVISGLPAMSFEQTEPDAKDGPTPAQALDAAVERTKAAATDVEFTETPEVDQRKRLMETMTRFYKQKLKPDDAAAKASLLFNEMTREQVGNDPGRVFKKGEVGPVEAKQIADYLEARMTKEEAVAQADVSAPVWDSPEPPPVHIFGPEVADEDEAPPMDAEPAARTASDSYMDLGAVVTRAEKVLGPQRGFIQEHPQTSGKFWFRDQPTVNAAGLKGAVLLQKGGEVVADVATMDMLARILAEECDKKERGGR